MVRGIRDDIFEMKWKTLRLNVTLGKVPLQWT